MTDLIRSTGKGERLTTLADVAKRADVPPGNVYYYFKTKEDLIRAVVDDYLDDADTMLAGLDRLRSPQARLRGLTRSWLDIADAVADHGCPVGSLCAELNKCDGELRKAGAEILGRVTNWAENKFRQLGRRDARDHAIALLAGIQGSALLANTFQDATIISRQTRYLEKWID